MPSQRQTQLIQSANSSLQHLKPGYLMCNGAMPPATCQDANNHRRLDGPEPERHVCVDMFLSNDQQQAQDSAKASHEVMVWFGKFGAATQPLGFGSTVALTESINGTTFNLYFAANGVGQQVFTWVAADNTTTFAGDLSPLIRKLSTLSTGQLVWPTWRLLCFRKRNPLRNGNMTFSVQRLDLDVNRS